MVILGEANNFAFTVEVEIFAAPNMTPDRPLFGLTLMLNRPL